MTQEIFDPPLARLVAFVRLIKAGKLDPDTVNMAYLAGVLEVHRGTVMRDLRRARAAVAEADQVEADLLGALPLAGQTRRHHD